MSNLKRYPAIRKYWAMNRYHNITLAHKSALRNLWGDVWHRIGIEWSKNRIPIAKFIKRIYHADSSSLETICQLAKECGLKLINRIDEDEIELVAPDAEDYSVIFAQAHYDDSLNYDYSDLEGLSLADAIGILKANLNKEIAPFNYIYLHFKTPSEFTGLRSKILIHSPLSGAFREFLITAKSKLEATAKVLHNKIDMSGERYTMMMKRHAYLKAVVSPFSCFDEFLCAKSEWFAILGINLVEHEGCLKITINLDYAGEYETYFVLPSNDGHLTISEIVEYQDDYCANSFLNITTQNVADEAKI